MTTEWIPTGGKKPILPSHVFVYVRFAGDSREEAEAYRDGYGQSVDSVHSWADTIEYRRKHPAPMTDDQTVTQALEPCPFCGGEGLSHRVARGWRVSCKNCDAQPRPGLPPKTEAEAITAWNTRTAHSGDAERWERIAAQRLVEISDKADEIVALSERVEALEGAGRRVCDGQATPASVNNLRTILSLRTSQKALDEINRQEQANIAGYLALRDFPVGSTSAPFPPDEVGPNKLGTDWQDIAAQLREIRRISNDYDLREAIEGHDSGVGDSGIWRDLMDQCERLAALAQPEAGGE